MKNPINPHLSTTLSFRFEIRYNNSRREKNIKSPLSLTTFAESDVGRPLSDSEMVEFTIIIYF